MRYYINGDDLANVDSLKLWLISEGHSIVCPVDVQQVLPELNTLEFYDMLRALIKMSDCIFIPRDWDKTKIGKAEVEFARIYGKKIRHESKQWALRSKGGELWNE